MKKILALLVSVVAVCSFGMAGASAANVNYTDFSEEAPANWTFGNGEIKDGVLEVAPSDSNTWQIWKMPKAYPTGTVVIEYDFKSNSEKFNMYIQSPAKGSICRMQQVNATTLQLQHSKDDASANQNTVITNKLFKADTWYHVKHVVNYAEEPNNTTTSVYMYDMGGNLIGSVENKVHMDAHRYDSGTYLNIIQMQNIGTSGNVYFDNFAVYENDADSVIEVNKKAIAIDTESLISESLTLKTKGYGDAEITWVSSNQEVLENDGTVILPEAPVTLELSATIAYGGKTETVVYPLTVASKGAHIVKADVYAYDFNDNMEFPGIEIKGTAGCSGIRNGRIELERPADTEITTSPQVIMDFTDMELKSFSGKLIAEFDYLSNADKGAKIFVQASPNSGSLLRFEQKEKLLQITTGGDGETAANKSYSYNSYKSGEIFHVKFVLDYDNLNCSVYVNGKAVVENHHFMTSVSPAALNTIHTIHDGTKGKFTIDNFVLYHDDADSSIVATEKMINFADFTAVKDDIVLSGEGCNGAEIAWTSSKPEILANDGTLLVNPENDTTVTLSAIISKDDYAMTKSFDVTVKGIAASDTVNVASPVIFDKMNNAVSASCSKGFAVVSYAVTKPADEAFSASVLAVVKDATGKLENIYIESDSIPSGRSYGEIKINIPEIAQNGGIVCLYLWDSISGLKPLDDANIYEVAAE